MKKTIAVLKNHHSKKEMDEMQDRWLEGIEKGEGMTLAESMEHAKLISEKANKSNARICDHISPDDCGHSVLLN